MVIKKSYILKQTCCWKQVFVIRRQCRTKGHFFMVKRLNQPSWLAEKENLTFGSPGTRSNHSKYSDLGNPFVPNAPFLYPLKTSEKFTVFWCFQGVEKGCIGNDWVNIRVLFVLLGYEMHNLVNIYVYRVLKWPD